MKMPIDTLKNLSTKDIRSLVANLQKENFQLREIINTIPGDVYWKDIHGVWLGINSSVFRV